VDTDEKYLQILDTVKDMKPGGVLDVSQIERIGVLRSRETSIFSLRRHPENWAIEQVIISDRRPPSNTAAVEASREAGEAGASGSVSGAALEQSTNKTAAQKRTVSTSADGRVLKDVIDLRKRVSFDATVNDVVCEAHLLTVFKAVAKPKLDRREDESLSPEQRKLKLSAMREVAETNAKAEIDQCPKCTEMYSQAARISKLPVRFELSRVHGFGQKQNELRLTFAPLNARLRKIANRWTEQESKDYAKRKVAPAVPSGANAKFLKDLRTPRAGFVNEALSFL